MQLAFAGGPTIEVEGASAGVETWLREYFASALAPGPAGPPVATIAVVYSAEERRRLRASRPPSARRRPVFAVEREMLEQPGWDDDGVLVIDYEPLAYVLLLEAGCTTIVLDPDVRRPRFITALILYELVALAMRPTRLELHAASVVADGRAHLILGDKGAGKTTLALALARGGACLLANDRAFVRPGGVLGMPTPVKLLPDTLAAFPEISRGPTPHEAFMLTSDELRQASSDNPPDDPLVLPPAEAGRRLGAPTVAGEQPLGTLVFPEVVPDLGGVESVPLAPDEVEHLLLANLYRAAAADREPTEFERLAGGRPVLPRPVAAELAARAPAHRVRLGAAALADPGLVRSIVEVGP